MRAEAVAAAAEQLLPEQPPVPRGVMQLAAGPQSKIFAAQWDKLPEALREHLAQAVEQRQLSVSPGNHTLGLAGRVPVCAQRSLHLASGACFAWMLHACYQVCYVRFCLVRFFFYLLSMVKGCFR
jgi:hypothetical protein